jgi:glycosyltransferase involved in cell wall biosynthesis
MGLCSAAGRGHSLKVVLFFSGLGKPGGISPDLRHLAAALTEEGINPTVTSRLREVLSAEAGRGTIVNVYGCLPSARNLGAMMLARARGQRLVWTPVFHPRRPATWKGSGLYRVMEVFDRTAPRLARFTHAVSAATEEEAAFFQAMGAPRTAVVPLVVGGTHEPLTGRDRASARRRLGVGDGPVVLLIAAHSPRRKGMDFAAGVLAELRRELVEATFLVVGGGSLGALAGQPGVTATGWCPENLLLDAYRSADLLFVPSRYEQFSRATIEAWACGTPVVLSDGVALAATADRSGAGVVVRFGDIPGAAAALAKALSDPAWRQQAGQRGRSLVEDRFLPADHLRATLGLYRSVT